MVPCSPEALHNQKTQVVYFLASDQYGLGVNHAYLPNIMKQQKKIKKVKTSPNFSCPQNKKDTEQAG